MKDLSRNEELLDALLNETELPEIKPKSRVEAYLYALCEKGLITANELKEINRILDSDDENLDQLSEIVAYIKKNRELTNQLSEEIAEPVSWNDLEDKPFYEHTEEKTILPTTSCNAVYCGAHYGCGVNSEDGLNSFLEEGKVYKVVFDGVEYVRTAEVVNNIVVLGNKKYGYNIITGSNTDEDTGEPFFIANYDNGSLGLKIRVEYEESFVISISSEDCVLKQLDSKYIKDMYYTELETVPVTRTITRSLIDEEFTQLLLKNRQTAQYIVDNVSYVYAQEVTSNDGSTTWIVVPKVGGNHIQIKVTKSSDSNVNDTIRILANGDANITIDTVVETVHRIDEKYIPDNTFRITLIDNGDGTYGTNKTIEEIIEAYYTDKKDLILDCSCMGAPYPRSLPFVGSFDGSFQFGYFGDAADSPYFMVPIFVGVTVTPDGAVRYIKCITDIDIQLLKTTDKTITGAINELKAEIDALKAQNQ